MKYIKINVYKDEINVKLQMFTVFLTYITSEKMNVFIS